MANREEKRTVGIHWGHGLCIIIFPVSQLLKESNEFKVLKSYMSVASSATKTVIIIFITASFKTHESFYDYLSPFNFPSHKKSSHKLVSCVQNVIYNSQLLATNILKGIPEEYCLKFYYYQRDN